MAVTVSGIFEELTLVCGADIATPKYLFLSTAKIVEVSKIDTWTFKRTMN